MYSSSLVTKCVTIPTLIYLYRRCGLFFEISIVGMDGIQIFIFQFLILNPLRRLGYEIYKRL